MTLAERIARTAPTRWLGLSTLLALLIFLATVPLPRVDGHLIGSDGLSYYAILRSAVLDGDLDFKNDYALVGVSPAIVEATGRPANPFSVGPALLWLPFFLLAHVISLLLSAVGAPVATNGVSYIYEAAICLGTISYASAGFWLAYKVARRLAEPSAALVATLALWWGSQVTYYILAEPSMSHGLTVFSNALFLWLWHPAQGRRDLRRWALLGVALGLVALVRWQDAVVGLAPVAELLVAVVRRRIRPGEALAAALALGGAALLTFVPQLLMWSAVYGQMLTIPQGNDFIRWTDPHPLLTLFSPRHGLLTWHPLLAIALLGLWWLWRRDRALALLIGWAFFAQLYINSAVGRWWADDAFGGRRFSSLVPLLVPPLALALEVWRPRRRLALAVITLLLVWNGLSLAQYRLGFISKDGPLTWREITVDRLLLPVTVLRRLL